MFLSLFRTGQVRSGQVEAVGADWDRPGQVRTEQGTIRQVRIDQSLLRQLEKNAGHDMAIVGEPCNADAHAKIPALFMSLLCPRLRNMSSAMCASSMYSRLCLKMSSFLFLRACTMYNAAYIIFIMWNSTSGLDAWYYFRFNISCGVVVTLRSHQIEFQVIF